MRQEELGQEAGFTLQEVPGTQVDVDAGVETRDEPVESSFLHTDPCKEKGSLRPTGFSILLAVRQEFNPTESGHPLSGHSLSIPGRATTFRSRIYL